MLEFFLLALGLGIKHSFDADHLVAVSHVLVKAKSLGQSVKMAVSWAAGHMLTAGIITVLLVSFKDSLLAGILEHFERMVAVMLIGLGLVSLYQARRFHAHAHRHADRRHMHSHLHVKGTSDHSHVHMLGIGIVQGLASNDELLLLLTVGLGLAGMTDMILGVGVFSLGVVLGMVAFSLFLTFPILRLGREHMQQVVNTGAGTVSVLYGVWMLAGLGIF